MKRCILFLLVIVVAILAFSGCAAAVSTTSQPPATSPTTASTSQPQKTQVRVLKGLANDPITNATTWDRVNMYVGNINKRLEGELKIEAFGPETVPIMEQADAVKSGAFDFEIYSPKGMAAALMPCCMVGDFTQYTAAEERQSGAFELWDEAYQKFLNVKYLGMWDNGPYVEYYLWTNEPINTVAEIKGMKIRVFGVFESVAKSWGGNPVAMALTEIYTAMQRGVVDGFITVPTVVSEGRLFEVTNYMNKPGFFHPVSTTYMNLGVWNSLSKNAQDVIMDETIAQEEFGVKWFKDRNEGAEVINTGGGMEINQMSQAEGDKLVDLASQAAWEFALGKDTTGYAERLRQVLTKQ
jgi:TRAP-type C4-dicarboxylate transport system substrate-binding protein